MVWWWFTRTETCCQLCSNWLYMCCVWINYFIILHNATGWLLSKRWIKFYQILHRRSFHKFVILSRVLKESAWQKWFLTQETIHGRIGRVYWICYCILTFPNLFVFYTLYFTTLSLLFSIICQKESTTFCDCLCLLRIWWPHSEETVSTHLLVYRQDN